MKNSRGRWLAWGVVSVAVLLGTPGCEVGTEEEACATYACVNTVSMSGEVSLPEDTAVVKLAYCNDADCITGAMDLRQTSAKPNCITDDAFQQSRICFTRSKNGKLAVDALLAGESNGELPADGARYTLTVTDKASGEVLLEETRKADYETTRQDTCHLCWSAEMSM